MKYNLVFLESFYIKYTENHVSVSNGFNYENVVWRTQV